MDLGLEAARVEQASTWPPLLRSETSSRRVPKPRRAEGFTGGPPTSIQLSTALPASPEVSFSSTRPAGADRAPYLTALVESSCNSSAIATTTSVGMFTSASAASRSKRPWSKGVSARSKRSVSGSGLPNAWVTRSCESAIDCRRAVSTASKPFTLVAPRAVWATMVIMIRMPFFARWASSRRIRLRRSSAILRSYVEIGAYDCRASRRRRRGSPARGSAIMCLAARRDGRAVFHGEDAVRVRGRLEVGLRTSSRSSADQCGVVANDEALMRHPEQFSVVRIPGHGAGRDVPFPENQAVARQRFCAAAGAPAGRGRAVSGVQRWPQLPLTSDHNLRAWRPCDNPGCPSVAPRPRGAAQHGQDHHRVGQFVGIVAVSGVNGRRGCRRTG